MRTGRIEQRRQAGWVLAGIAAFGAAALMGAGIRHDPIDSVAGAIFSETEAFVPLPPEVVVASGTDSVDPSTTGGYALIKRGARSPIKSLTDDRSLSGEASLVLLNVFTRRTTILWHRSVNEETIKQTPQIIEISWLPQSATALIVFAPMENGEISGPMNLMAVDALRGILRNITTMAPEDGLIVAVDRPLALIASGDLKTALLLRPDGTPGRTVTFSEPGIRFMGWMADGKTIYGLRPPTGKDATDAGTKKSRWVLADSQTGLVTSSDKRPAFPKTASLMPLPPLAIRTGAGTLTEGETAAKVTPLWLEGATTNVTGRTLIAPDGEKPLLLPTAALYQRHGALFAVPLLRMNRVAFAKLQKEAQRRKTMENAKMIGLAMMMYCQDYDENFAPPGSGQAVADLINPYMKNRDAFNDPSTGQMGFSPIYKSVNLTGYDNPSTQILGYLSGPDGRAAIYVDGHVKWEDNP